MKMSIDGDVLSNERNPIIDAKESLASYANIVEIEAFYLPSPHITPTEMQKKDFHLKWTNLLVPILERVLSSVYPYLHKVVKSGGKIIGLHSRNDANKELPELFPNLFESSIGTTILHSIK